MTTHYLGLDMGGTNVKAGITDPHGKLLAHVSVPTGKGGKDLRADLVIARMVEAGEQAIAKANLKKSDVAAVGILSPGQAHLGQGIVIRASNFPLWKNVHIRAKVSKGLGLPGVLENDASAAAYGEWWAGAGRIASKTAKPLDNLFMFTLGTGVGGGLIYEGKVVRGSFDFATEIGHMIMHPGPGNGGGERELCGCGQHGCLEAYASASYTGRRATRQLEQSKKIRKKSTLGRVYKSAGKVTAADVAQHAQAGDKFALSVWDETCYILALACINVCHFIDPQMIVLAGGMAQAGKFLLDTVHKHFN
jgi:glucokinase